MNPKKLRIIILACIVLLIILIISSVINNSSTSKESNNAIENSDDKKNVYSFNQTINLDDEDTEKRYDPEIGTDYPDYGVISDYYDNADISYGDNKLYVQTQNGYSIISDTWSNEGYGAYINEPQFGEIKKFILTSPNINVSYINVKMKDVISYINELSGLGFNEVVKNEKNNSSDYYIYSAKKGDITVTLNYEEGKLEISVF